MKRVADRAVLRHALERVRGRGSRIGFVPTMGFLHEGHLSLVDRARARADYVVVSIFVNPLQFGPGEDFEEYPRDLARDERLLRARSADLVFTPAPRELYPQGAPQVRVAPGPLADELCGGYRPGHFEGVLTVLAKLFNLVQPHVAVFGQKDFQQCVLVRRMVRDLDFPIEIDVAPIVREEDGLAMSSRNTYLDGAQRARAGSLYRALCRTRDAFRAGVHDAERLRTVLRGELADEVEPQYVELVNAETLEPVATASPGDVVAVAAFVGRIRLIDNIVLD